MGKKMIAILKGMARTMDIAPSDPPPFRPWTVLSGCVVHGNAPGKRFGTRSLNTIVKNPPSSRQPGPSSGSRAQAVAVSTTKMMSGPLPSPEILAQYNALIPGAADRIIAMAENDSAHLQTIEKMTVTAFYRERQTGQTFGLIIALFGLSVAALLAMNNHETTASIIGGTTIVGLVGIFVIGRLAPAKTQSSPE